MSASTRTVTYRVPTIGVMDSGHGGLTVVRELNRVFEGRRVNICYIGDAVNFPYGNKSMDEIVTESSRLIRHFIQKKVSAVNIACNSISSALIPGLKFIEATAGFPIIGMVESGSRMALEASKNDKIGIMGTRATICSGAYQQMLSSYSAAIGRDISLFPIACKDLAQQVEDGKINDPETAELIDGYVDVFKQNDVRSIVLGCTHYPFVSDLIKRSMGRNVTLLNPAIRVAEQTYDFVRSTISLGRGRVENKFFYTCDASGNGGNDDSPWIAPDKKRLWEGLTGIANIDARPLQIDSPFTDWTRWASLTTSNKQIP